MIVTKRLEIETESAGVRFERARHKLQPSGLRGSHRYYLEYIFYSNHAVHEVIVHEVMPGFAGYAGYGLHTGGRIAFIGMDNRPRKRRLTAQI